MYAQARNLHAWAIAIVFVAACVFLLSVLHAQQGRTEQPAHLSLDEFESRYNQLFAQGDFPAINKLASNHQDLLRPLVERLLDDLSQNAPESSTDAARRRYAVAATVAELAKELSSDPFPAQQIRLHQSWSRGERALKFKADALLQEAKTAFEQGRYGDVLLPGRHALALYTQLNDEAGEGDSLHFLGQAERQLADYPAALAHHDQALALAGRAGDRLRTGQALIDLGDVRERQKDEDQAKHLYLQALQTLKIPADWREVARALRQTGDIDVVTGHFENAYGAFRRALAYAEAANDPEAVAEFNDYLGFCHRKLGDYQAAIEYHRRALESAKGISSGGRRWRARARSFNHLGLAAASLAEATSSEDKPDGAVEKYREAIGYEEEALALSRDVQDRWRQGYVLRALSSLHRELGRLLRAKDAAVEYSQSLTRADEALELAVTMRDKEWEGLALHDRALALALLGREEEGLAASEKALGLWERIGDVKSAGYAHWFVARRFHETRGRFPEALAAYDRALGAFGKIGDVESQACVIADQARVFAALGRYEEAARLYDAGLAKFENARTAAGFPEFRKVFLGKVYDRYEEAALFALVHGFNTRAFRYVESVKARTFLDQLAEEHVELEKGVDPDLKIKRDGLEKSLTRVRDTMIEEYKKKSPEETVLNATKVEMERLTRELDQVKKDIRLNNPLYAAVQYPEPVSLPDLQGNILSGDEVLLEYFVTPKGVFCFVVSKDGFDTAKLTDSDKQLRDTIEPLLDNLVAGPRRGEGYDRAGASALYDLLLKPVERYLKDKTLIIVPDGIIARFPFEALISETDGERAFVLEKHAVKYVQSASVLAALRDPGRFSGMRDDFIGFGDPVYDYEDFKLGKPEQNITTFGPGNSGSLDQQRYAELGGPLNRLEASGDEVRGIARIFEARKLAAKALLRDKATKGNAKTAEMERYGFIHFAMHGILTPTFQALAFSRVPDDGNGGGLLTMGEIMNLRYNARLIVLSACNTGLGKMERGEGVTGLTRAVMYAGSPAALVSLWSVDDIGTRELMTRFYWEMLQNGSLTANALRSAKLKMLKTHYRHPFFWAAFVLYGE